MTRIIIKSGQVLNQEATGIYMEKAIFAQTRERKNDRIGYALKQVKSEIQIYF